MARRRSKPRTSKQGLPPGTPVYTGQYTDVKVEADVIDYGPDFLEERLGVPFSEVLRCRDSATVSWLDLRGLHDASAIAAVGEHFGIHPLAVEDALSADGRTKVDDYGDVLFVTVKMTDLEPGSSPPRVRVEHVALALGPTWVLSFQELPGDVFEPVRRRIRTSTGRIRRMPAAYLLHALLDAIVDGYFVVLSALQDELDRLEDLALAGGDRELPRRVHDLRGEIHQLRRAVAPLRYAAGDMIRLEARRIDPEVRPYLRDLVDHLEQVHDELESARERLVGLLEIYLASNSHRMNDVMRALTIVSTVFMPLTFIAGIYGMNFTWMPETDVWWGYPVSLALMAVVGGAMVWWMRRRRWMG